MKITTDLVKNLIKQANKQFETDFKLVGSWSKPNKKRTHPPRDIDVFTEKSKSVDEAGLWIARKTGLVVDVWCDRFNFAYHIFPYCPTWVISMTTIRYNHKSIFDAINWIQSEEYMN